MLFDIVIISYQGKENINSLVKVKKMIKILIKLESSKQTKVKQSLTMVWHVSVPYSNAGSILSPSKGPTT